MPEDHCPAISQVTAVDDQFGTHRRIHPWQRPGGDGVGGHGGHREAGAVRRSGHPCLCVITWNEDAIRPWVSAVRPTVLGDRSAWEDLTPELDPVVVEAMKSLTLTVNHNNTISAGFGKDMVVSSLLALHDAGIRMDGEAMQGWTLANGWSGKP